MRRWNLVGAVAALVAVTLWINLGAIHRYQNADSLVMPLISIFRWTPLFWEQNRLGMLIPALASPFHHPLTNLLVQSGLTTLSGLSGFFLLGFYVAGRRRGLAIGSLGALLFVLATRLWQQFDYLIYIHQYATSLTLALLALIVLARPQQCGWRRQYDWRRQGGWWRPIAAVALIWLALWVNPSLAFALAPLVLLRPFFLRDAACEFDRLDDEPPVLIVVPEPAGSSVMDKKNFSPSVIRFPRRLLASYAAADGIALVATGSGLLLSMAISHYASTVHEPYQLLTPREWLTCAAGILRNMPGALDSAWLAAVSVVALSGLVTLGWSAGRRSFAGSARLLLGLLLPAVVQFAFIASLDHVHRTDYSRYAFAAVFLWQGDLPAVRRRAVDRGVAQRPARTGSAVCNAGPVLRGGGGASRTAGYGRGAQQFGRGGRKVHSRSARSALHACDRRLLQRLAHRFLRQSAAGRSGLSLHRVGHRAAMPPHSRPLDSGAVVRNQDCRDNRRRSPFAAGFEPLRHHSARGRLRRRRHPRGESHDIARGNLDRPATAITRRVYACPWLCQCWKQRRIGTGRASGTRAKLNVNVYPFATTRSLPIHVRKTSGTTIDPSAC